MPELVLQRVEDFRGDGRQSLLAGACQAWIMPRGARCACPGQMAAG
jgi:hypothetical protein